VDDYLSAKAQLPNQILPLSGRKGEMQISLNEPRPLYVRPIVTVVDSTRAFGFLKKDSVLKKTGGGGTTSYLLLYIK